MGDIRALLIAIKSGGYIDALCPNADKSLCPTQRNSPDNIPQQWLALFVGSLFPWFALDYSRWLLIIGLLSWTFPVSTLIIYSGISRIPLRSVWAAENLGATFIDCQRYLVIPRTRLHIVIAFVSSFSFAITDNFSTQLMNQNRDYLLAGVISDLLKMQNWTLTSILATSVVLLEVIVPLALAASRVIREQ